ncbi:hypothetical protein F4604DRAFT_1740232 [Suillus subluteus]|nr:hypothetical protein F4604DRAFT_1740232 [Suillus subluteus]
MRLEQGFMQGAQIGVFYDPMIVRLAVCGHSAKPLFDAIQCQRERCGKITGRANKKGGPEVRASASR